MGLRARRVARRKAVSACRARGLGAGEASIAPVRRLGRAGPSARASRRVEGRQDARPRGPERQGTRTAHVLPSRAAGGGAHGLGRARVPRHAARVSPRGSSASRTTRSGTCISTRGTSRGSASRIGQFPVRDWFWERVPRCADAASFVATMGLGIESANLEHSASFAARFREAGDEEGARLQERVGREEIGHVRFGATLVRGVPLHPRFRDLAPRAGLRRFRPCSCAAGRCSARRACARARPSSFSTSSRHGSRIRLGPEPRRRRRAGRDRLGRRRRARGVRAEAQRSRGDARASCRQLAASLLDPEQDLLVDEDSPPLIARGMVGRAFCPTPRALRLLRRAGAEPEPHPECDVLVRVNARAFASSLGTTLPGAAFVAHEVEARARLGTPPPPELSEAWRVKRNFGMAGRGQRVVVPVPADRGGHGLRARGPPGGWGADRARCRHRGRAGDPRARSRRVARLTLGPVVKQRCDARGAWVSSERMPSEQAPPELPREAERVAAALTRSGLLRAVRRRRLHVPLASRRRESRCSGGARSTPASRWGSW